MISVITADEMVEAYVSDVVGFLPGKQRRDVAQELRTLLTEEIDAAQGTTREESARKVLAGFGRPAEVATRYGPPPMTLIDASDTRRVITLAVGGAVLIVVAAVFDVLLEDVRPRTIPDPSMLVLAWWGVLAAWFAVAAGLRRQRGSVAWKPHPVATDRINRFGWAAALVFFSAGTLALAAPHWVIDRLTGGRAHPTVYDVFTFDPDFLELRGPLTLAVMIASLLYLAVLVVMGRWTPWLRNVDLAYNIAICVLLTWSVAEGPVYTWPTTDQAVRPILALIVLFSLADLAVRSHRQSVRRALAQS